jgi:hypothetical protein
MTTLAPPFILFLTIAIFYFIFCCCSRSPAHGTRFSPLRDIDPRLLSASPRAKQITSSLHHHQSASRSISPSPSTSPTVKKKLFYPSSSATDEPVTTISDLTLTDSSTGVDAEGEAGSFSSPHTIHTAATDNTTFKLVGFDPTFNASTNVNSTPASSLGLNDPITPSKSNASSSLSQAIKALYAFHFSFFHFGYVSEC